MKTTTKQVLERARTLVAKGWTQGAIAMRPLALAAAHEPCDAGDERATHWCAMGAMDLAVAELDGNTTYAYCAFRNGAQVPSDKAISVWNDADGRTQAQVLAAFDRAIAQVQS